VWVQSSIPTSTVGDRFQFIVFQFSYRPGLTFPRLFTGLFSWSAVRRWVGKPCVMHDAYLFLLQFHAGHFVASWLREMVLLFSVQCSIGRLSKG
jgi:hypothetical protein